MKLNAINVDIRQTSSFLRGWSTFTFSMIFDVFVDSIGEIRKDLEISLVSAPTTSNKGSRQCCSYWRTRSSRRTINKMSGPSENVKFTSVIWIFWFLFTFREVKARQLYKELAANSDQRRRNQTRAGRVTWWRSCGNCRNDKKRNRKPKPSGKTWPWDFHSGSESS